MSNKTVKIKEYDGELVFLHKIVEGFSNHSFGIKVASLAGIPQEVTKRAAEILKDLENKADFGVSEKEIMENLISGKEKDTQSTLYQSDTFDFIQSLNIDEVSPKEALHLLYKIQKDLKS